MALEAIRPISAQVKDAIVGVGTVVNAQQFADAVSEGSKFVVSPGLTEEVVHASRDHMVSILPGVATASDIMRGLGLGLTSFKFFPAETSGGVPAIKAKSLVALGLIDTTSPPFGVFAAFNQIKEPKEAVPMPDSDHNNVSPQQEGAYYARSREALEALPKTGSFTPNSRWAKP